MEALHWGANLGHRQRNGDLGYSAGFQTRLDETWVTKYCGVLATFCNLS